MLNWVQPFSIFLFLDSNEYAMPYGRYECLLAAGTAAMLPVSDDGSLTALHTFNSEKKDWLFGHINYDYKNVLDPKLSSSHIAKLGFPNMHFFQPEIVCHISSDGTALSIESLSNSPAAIYNEICNAPAEIAQQLPNIDFKQVLDKEEYLQTIDKLRQHIADGDCYEVNFCNEAYCENVSINPLNVCLKLNTISPAPFAAFYRLNHLSMISASPERYLQKNGLKLVAQPIKGTAARSKEEKIDNDLKIALRNSIKEQAENVMITDLMRNDLARVCETGSISVDELFGIYTFPQVHQMISTISGTLKQGLSFADALAHSFPMGSMTGAPKIKVMQLIDRYEQSRRELFSGTVGYITPGGDFDFNVIIRSLFYNATTKYLSYQTGGAITYDSVPGQEWDEMQLKAWALQKIFKT